MDDGKSCQLLEMLFLSGYLQDGFFPMIKPHVIVEFQVLDANNC